MNSSRTQTDEFKKMASSFKELIRGACVRRGEPEAALAVTLLASTPHINNMANEHQPLHTDILIRAINHTGDLGPAHEFARQIGCVLTSRTEATGSNLFSKHLPNAAKEFGEAIAVISESIEDGRVTDDELKAVSIQVNQACTAFRQLEADLEAMKLKHEVFYARSMAEAETM